MAIDDRKQRILMAIVSLYASDGEPVGSNLLSRYFDMAVSSATLRNEMAALTKMGLLEQPHTSAGRVPTAKGYRYYVDHSLFLPAELAGGQRAEIERLFMGLDYDPEKLAQGAAKALSDLLELAVLITTPRADDTCIVHFEVIQVGRFSAAVLAVTGAGSVLTRVAKVDFQLTDREMDALEKLLNEQLRFVREPDITPGLIRATMKEAGDAYWPLVSAALTLLSEAGKPSVYLEGQHYLLRFPELEGSLHTLLRLMTDENKVESIFRLEDSHTRVVLGDELREPRLPGLCAVAKQYLAGGGLSGTVAVLGPTRLKFGEVIPRLEYFSELLGRTMSGSA